MNLYFWKNWQKPLFAFYSFLLFVLATAILNYVACLIWGTDWAISWQNAEDLQAHPFILETFSKNFFNFDYQLDSFLLVNEFKAAAIQTPDIQVWAYAFFLLLAWHILLTVGTFLTRTWYALFTGSWLLFLVLAHLELLEIGQERTFLAVVAISYVGLSYALYAIENKLNFLFRFGILASLGLIFGLLVAYFSSLSAPILLLTNYSMAIPLALTLVFVAINAHEILRGFLFLVIEKRSNNPSGLKHFLVISSVYLLNLLYVYFYNIKVFDWGIFYISPFVLFPFTVILGIWGFAIRPNQYNFIFNFVPNGAFVYLALALISLSSATYAFATANDVLVEVFEDIFLYLHLGLGVGFVFYVVSNYTNFIRSKYDIYQVLYLGGQMGRIDFYWVQILGLVVVLGLMSRTDYFTYRQAWAGYFNYVGDMYVAQNEELAAEQQYRSAAGYEFQNHKSNYSLAYLLLQKNQPALAYSYFQNALSKKPNPQTYANLGHLLNQRNDFLQAIFVLNEGINKYPNEFRLFNNTALMFGKTDIADSTFYYFDVAKNLDKNNAFIDANFYAFWAKFDFIKKPDSINQIINPTQNLQVAANELVMRNKLKSVSPKQLDKNYLPDSTLSRLDLCYLYNYTINQYSTPDSSYLKIVEKYEKYESNSVYKTFLQTARSFKYYGTGNHWQAIRLLKKLNLEADQLTPQFAFWLGHYFMQFDRFAEAADYYDQAAQKSKYEARFYKALALLELPNKAEALPILDQVAKDSSYFSEAASQLFRLVYPDSVRKLDFDKLNDIERYWFAHYNPYNLDENSFRNLLERFKNGDRKVVCAIDRIKFLLKNGNMEAAKKLRTEVVGIRGIERTTLTELNLVDLEILYKNQDFSKMENILSKMQFDNKNRGYKHFYEAVLHKNSQEAEKLFALALQELPFDEKVVLAFADSYYKKGNKQKAYDLLNAYTYRFDDALLFPVPLMKTYMLLCAELGFENFSDPLLEDLNYLVLPKDFSDFKQKYEQEKARFAATLSSF